MSNPETVHEYAPFHVEPTPTPATNTTNLLRCTCEEAVKRNRTAYESLAVGMLALVKAIEIVSDDLEATKGRLDRLEQRYAREHDDE